MQRFHLNTSRWKIKSYYPVLANVTMRPGAGTMYCELLGFTVGIPAEVVQPGIVSFTRITSKTAGKCNDIQEVNTMFHLCLKS